MRYSVAVLVPALGLFLTGCKTEVVTDRFERGAPKIVHTYAGKDTARENLRRLQTFYFNGHPETDARYRAGELHGEFISYWHNGQIKSHGEYRNGRKEGPWTNFYNKYSRSSEGRFVDDREDGEWTEYWENGSPKSRGIYAGGRKTGEWISWDESGTKVLENSCFPTNETGDYRAYHGNGKPAETHACRWGKPMGDYLRLDPSGMVLERGRYDSAGRKEGFWETFHTNGLPAESAGYSQGFLSDSSIQWDEAGRIVARGYFQNGTGDLTRFDSSGTVVETLPFVAGKREGEAREFHPSGARKAEVLYRNDIPVYLKKWHPNGRASLEGAYSEGKRNGLWKSFSDSGVLLEEAEYILGQLHGTRMIYEEKTGKLLRRQEYIRGYPSRGHVPESARE